MHRKRRPHTTVHLPADIHRRVRIAAALQGITIQAWLANAVSQALDAENATSSVSDARDDMPPSIRHGFNPHPTKRPGAALP